MGTRFSQGRRKPVPNEKPPYVSEEEQTTYVSKKEINYLTQMFQFVNNDRKKGEFCDTIVASRNQYFMVHSIMLACNSYIFRNITERYINHHKRLTIYVDSIKPHIFELLLEYIYTGKLGLKRTNVAEVSMAAMDLKIPTICELCTNFIQDMDLEQALIIILTKNIPLSNQVFRMAFQFVENNFSKVCEHELYMKIEINVLSRLLSSDNLNIRWELEVLDNLLKWTYHSFKNRKNYFSSLIKHVRFTQMTMQELRYACTMAKLFRESSVCEIVVAESVRQRYLLLKGDLNHTSENPRNCFKTAEENSTTGANNCLTSSILEGNIQSKPNIMQISGGKSCVTNVKSDLVPKLKSEEICNHNRNRQFSPNVFNNIQSFMGNSMNARSCENISSVQLNKRDGKLQTQSKIGSSLNKSSFNQFKEILDGSNQLVKATTEFKSDLTKQKAVTHDNSAQINVVPVLIEKSASVLLSKRSNAIDLSSDIYNLFDYTTEINPLYADKESKLFPLDNSSKIKTICGQTKNLRIKRQSKMRLFIKSNRLKVNNRISKILHKRTSGISCMFVRRKKPTIIKDSYLTLKSKTVLGGVENGLINNKKHFPSASPIFSKSKMFTCHNNDTTTIRRYGRVKYIEGGFCNCVLSNSEAGSGTELENDENSNNENSTPLGNTGIKLDHISQPEEQAHDRRTFLDDIEDENHEVTPVIHGPVIRLTKTHLTSDEKKTLPDFHRRVTYGTNISIKTGEPLSPGTNVTSAYIWENSSISRPVIMMKNTDFNYNLPNVCSVLSTPDSISKPLPDLTTFLTQRRNSVDVCTDLFRFARKRSMPKKCFSDEVLSVWETELKKGISEAAENYKHSVLFNKKNQKVRMVSRIVEVDSNSSETPVTANDDKNHSQHTKSMELNSSNKTNMILRFSTEACLDTVPEVDYNIENKIGTNEKDKHTNENNYDSAKEETSLDLLSIQAVAACSCTSMPTMDTIKCVVLASDIKTCNECKDIEPTSASAPPRKTTETQDFNMDLAEQEKDSVNYLMGGGKVEEYDIYKNRKDASTSASPKEINQAQKTRESEEINIDLAKQEQDTVKYVVVGGNIERCKICKNIKPTSPNEINEPQETGQPEEIDINLAKQNQDTVEYVVFGSDVERCKVCKNLKTASTSPKKINQAQQTRQPEKVNFAKQEQDTADYLMAGRKMVRCKICKNYKVVSTSVPPYEISQAQEIREPREIDIDLAKQEQDTVDYVMAGRMMERCKICKNFKVTSTSASPKMISEPQETRQLRKIDIDLTKQEQDTVEYVMAGNKMQRCKICKQFKVASTSASPQMISEPQETIEPREIDIDLAKQEQDTVEYLVTGNKMQRCKICKQFKVASTSASPKMISGPQETRQLGEIDIDLAKQEQDSVNYTVADSKMERCMICNNLKLALTSASPEEISEPQEISRDLAKQEQDSAEYVVPDDTKEICDICKNMKSPSTPTQPQEVNIDLGEQAEGSTKYFVTNDNKYIDINAASTSRVVKEVYQPQDIKVHYAEPEPACHYCLVDDIDDLVDVSSSFLTFEEPCCCCSKPHSFETELTRILEDHIAQPCCAHIYRVEDCRHNL
ncbi:actin-binding IPP [Octopus vulgaris]|uniref:Actin-binding IPP n=1 Tax=Octopus vulgaris TaxID=6645 RepID=A0AA36BA65_OCTVU|nr:actin-binding IPP [Octopus vulgaris]